MKTNKVLGISDSSGKFVSLEEIPTCGIEYWVCDNSNSPADGYRLISCHKTFEEAIKALNSLIENENFNESNLSIQEFERFVTSVN